MVTKPRSDEKPATIDAYLATVDGTARATLEKLRRVIRAAVPDAQECMSYGMPAFRLDGKLIAGFNASKKHCGYYPMSGSVVEALKDELADYETSKGTVRFAIDKPLPVALVKKLLKARIAEGA